MDGQCKPSYPRYRDKSEPEVLGDLKWYTQEDGGPKELYATIEQSLSTHEEGMSDIVTPCYKKLQQDGHVINNPMSASRKTTSCGGGSYYHRYGISTNTVDSSSGSVTRWQTLNNFNPGELLHVDATAIATAIRQGKLEAIGKIDSTPYSLMEDLMETNETVNTLRRPLGTANKAADRFRRSAKTGLAQGMSAVQAVSDAWLGVRMGFAPIVRSAVDVAESLDRYRVKPFPRRVARWTTELSDGDYNEVVGSAPYFKRHSITRKCNCLIRVGILYEARVPSLTPFEYYGIRQKDVPKGLWQVMPYSWAIDRFVDVSNCIGGVTNLLDPNIEILAAWVTKSTYSHREDVMNAGYSTLGPPAETLTIIGDPLVTEESAKSRSVWHPSVSDLVPPLQNGFDDILSNLDLLSVVIGKLRNPFRGKHSMRQYTE